MRATFRLLPLAGALLLLATASACAETPYPDPIAPAVLGRPISQVRPARPLRSKPALAKAAPRHQVAAASRRARIRPADSVALAPAAVRPAPALPQATVQPPVARTEPPPQVAAAAAQATLGAGKPFGPGAYFSTQDHALVRVYYAGHPASVPAARWKVGERIPPNAELAGVPDAVRAALPAPPPGHQYVEVDGDVVLVAVQSRVVVDGISRGMP